MDGLWSLALYGLPLVAILGIYLWRQRRIDARHRRAHEESIAAGMTEPASLHPLIDPSQMSRLRSVRQSLPGAAAP